MVRPCSVINTRDSFTLANQRLSQAVQPRKLKAVEYIAACLKGIPLCFSRRVSSDDLAFSAVPGRTHINLGGCRLQGGFVTIRDEGSR